MIRVQHVIIGASGQVGGYLQRTLARLGEDVRGTYYRHPEPSLTQLDITEPKEVQDFFNALKRVDVVWIPAAMANVDQCQQDVNASHLHNVEAPGYVAQSTMKRGGRVVFFSTDYVFDGHNGPYGEEDPTHPIQVYGQHKEEIEQYLRKEIPHALIIRPAWIYSRDENPRNFVYRVLEQLKENKPVKAVIDQWNTPTPSEGLVKMAWQAVQDGFEGILHIAGPERLTRYDLTCRIAKAFGYDVSLIEPVNTASFHLPASRPLNGGLITQYAPYKMESGRDFTPVF